MSKKRHRKAAKMNTRAPLISDDDSGHTCEFELTKSSDGKDVEFYVVFDGERIAYRGQPDTSEARTWVSMKSGYEVRDINNNNGIAVWINGSCIN